MNRLMPDALLSTMWNLASSAIAGTLGMSRNSSKTTLVSSDCSDDEASSNRDESLLECPICWESFNIVENVPYVLWCGHTLCKNCVLGLQWAVVKLPAVPLQLPLFVSCPWCHLLSFRWVYKGNMKFPRKNFFVLWMVESMNGDRVMSHSDSTFNQLDWCSSTNLPSIRRRAPRVHPLEDSGNRRTGHLNIRLSNYLNLASLNASLRKSLTFFVTLMAKLPFVIIFLLIVLYGIPASAVILVLYALVTIAVALPAFLVLYFAYPILEWLVKEIRN